MALAAGGLGVQQVGPAGRRRAWVKALAGLARRGAGAGWRGWLLPLLMAGWLGSAAAQALDVPPLDARVIDRTGTLDPAAKGALAERLASLERETGAQVVVLMVAATAPEDIAAYAHRVADTWKLGRREVGDGLLIVVAKDDRKVRIEVAKALEGAVPDLAARQVIDRAIRPAFRQGDYAGGLTAAVEMLGARVRDERAGTGAAAAQAAATVAAPGEPDEDGWVMIALVAVPLGAIVLTGLFGRALGSLLAGVGTGALVAWGMHSLGWGVLAGVVATLVIGFVNLVQAAGKALAGRGYQAQRRRAGRAARDAGLGAGGWGLGGGGSGGWSGGDDGGGFSSGGGGDFGGGGASGDW